MAKCRTHGWDGLQQVCVSCWRDGQRLMDEHWNHELERLSGERDDLLDEVERLKQRLALVEQRERPQLSAGTSVPQIGACVYFVRREADGLIKIGVTVDLRARMAQLANGAGPLTLLGTIPGGPALEAAMHKRFAYAREHGEWFRPSARLLTCIRNEAFSPDEMRELVA